MTSPSCTESYDRIVKLVDTAEGDVLKAQKDFEKAKGRLSLAWAKFRTLKEALSKITPPSVSK